MSAMSKDRKRQVLTLCSVLTFLGVPKPDFSYTPWAGLQHLLIPKVIKVKKGG